MPRAAPFLAAVLATLLLPPSAVRAQATQPGSRLEEVERALEGTRSRSKELEQEAEKLRGEVGSLTEQAIAAAARAQGLESALGDLEVTLAVLEVERRRKAAALEARRGQLAHTLAALQRISLQPPQAFLAAPAPPLDRLRGALLLSRAVPTLEERARALKGELAQLASLGEEIVRRRAELTGSLEALAAERQAIEGLLKQKETLVGETREAKAALETRARQLASEAGSLRELLARLEEERRERIAQAAAERLALSRPSGEEGAAEGGRTAAGGAGAGESRAEPTPRLGREAAASQLARLARPQELRPFPETPGGLALPARGPVIVRYGERSTRVQEETAKGIVIETRPGATVVAPYDGRVVYAGVFRRYGLILIIEHDGQYHSLLAGFDRLNATPGQWLLAGEPVGVMQAAGDRKPELYLELRQSGQPVDPLPWLAQGNGDKARG